MLFLYRLVFACVFQLSLLQEAQGTERIEDVAFISRVDGTVQHYVLIEPPEGFVGGGCDVLIVLHGHGSDRWQFVQQPRAECAETRRVAAESGMLLVSPDYRAPASWLGPAAESDMLQILDELHLRYPVRRVLISGGSMGGTAALSFAALHPECVDGVVSLNGTANLMEYEGFQEAIRESYGGSREERPEVYRTRSAEFFPERLTMPLAATTGGGDRIVPPDSVLRLTGILRERGAPVLGLHRPAGGHDTNAEDTRTAYRHVLDAWSASAAAARRTAVLGEASAQAGAPLKIVCLGDSVTGVYYHTGGRRAWPELLEDALKKALPGREISVINAGISGHTTRDGLARLERDVLRHNPAVVTISFGLNDLTRISEADFCEGLRELVARCRQQGAVIVLCTPNAVLETAARPVQKLERYCELIRSTAAELGVAVCDQYAAGQRFRARAPGAWRETLSDEIHPNLAGHRLMAEELCRCLTGETVSLFSKGPQSPLLPRVQSVLAGDGRLRVLVMQPLRGMFEDVAAATGLKERLEIIEWATEGRSLVQLEADAQQRVRNLRPDLVLLTVPVPLGVDGEEQRLKSLTWLLNWSLDFGRSSWDCVVLHPDLIAGSAHSLAEPERQLLERVVRNQDLPLVQRPVNVAEQQTSAAVFAAWLQAALSVSP